MKKRTLCDEIRGKRVLELLLVLERIMSLSVWHGAGLEPTIEDLRDSPQHSLPHLGGNSQLIHTKRKNKNGKTGFRRLWRRSRGSNRRLDRIMQTLEVLRIMDMTL